MRSAAIWRLWGPDPEPAVAGAPGAEQRAAGRRKDIAMPTEVSGLNRVLHAALAAGLAAAVIEMLFVLPIQAMLGASPMVVFQSIASGALGQAAFSGGLATAALGAGVHLLISLVAGGIYVVAADRWPWLLRRPFSGGILFGLAVYVVMNFGVIPLSRIGFNLPKSPELLALSLSIHLFAFGLPIGLVARAMLTRR
jgi:uncharacterized membrane protein YagU involved in acid resistance